MWAGVVWEEEAVEGVEVEIVGDTIAISCLKRVVRCGGCTCLWYLPSQERSLVLVLTFWYDEVDKAGEWIVSVRS